MASSMNFTYWFPLGEKDRKNHSRFNLLLLEDGEYYFEDWVVYFYPYPDEYSSFSLQQCLQRCARGRLRACSRSLLFEPDDSRFPLMRLPFRHMPDPPQHVQIERHSEEIPILYSVGVTKLIEMKKDGKIGPYVVRRVVEDAVFRGSPLARYMFSLQYETEFDSKALPWIHHLWDVQKILRVESHGPSVEEARLLEPILNERIRETFDTSLLRDFREQILTNKPLSAQRINPFVAVPGSIVLTNKRLYFQYSRINNMSSKPVKVIDTSRIVRIAKRRYMLRHCALDVFLQSRKSLLFAFKSIEDRDHLHDLLLSQPGITAFSHSETQSMLQRWQNREISNFEYLMYLNSAADRSFNDLTQYPVFPWIIADYTSENLDMTNPDTYRDLSKPIGALNEERLASFQLRFREMPSGSDSIPPFLYGTHYSTPGYVLYYLVRRAPEHVLRLQNGKFDTADRMFFSMADTWRSVLINPTDLKELIPEFYHDSADFLFNLKNMDFGQRQNKQKVNDVMLPPWARDGQDFIRQCREFLESDYVSEHLHEWIDLIFGYKQQGPEAEKANNVFYFITYEGSIDIESVQDPIERLALESQIGEFGQTPKQLFLSAHPPRNSGFSPVRLASLRVSRSTLLPDCVDLLAITEEDHKIKHNVDSLSEIEQSTSPTNEFQEENSTHWLLEELQPQQPIKIHREAITDICISSDASEFVSTSRDNSLKLFSLTEARQRRSNNVCESCLSACVLDSTENVAIIGSWDNCIHYYSIATGKIITSFLAHDDAVSCLCIMGDVLVSGSWDSTIKVWIFSLTTRPMPIIQFLDHEAGVCSVSINKLANKIASGSLEGQVCIHDLQVKHLVCCLQACPHQSNVCSVHFLSPPFDDLVMFCTCAGFIGVCGDERVLSSVNIDNEISSSCVSGEYIVIGTTRGQVLLWKLDIRSRASISFSFVSSLPPHSSAVSSLACSHNEKTLIVGHNDGSIIIRKS